MPFDRSQLNSPSFIQSLIGSQRQVKATLSQLAGTNIESTSSFFYDRPGDGIKSTQQLNVDWSRFENHTFFNSAEAKVNIAIDQVINFFPFDGTRKDYEVFFERLTGFERWVYDRFPKNVGYLMFSGSSGSVPGSYISTSGISGVTYPTLSNNKSGVNVLDQGTRSFSIESQLFLPAQANGLEVVYQKLADSAHGFSLYLLPTASVSQATLLWSVISGSNTLFNSVSVKKGQFNHIVTALNKDPRKNKTQFYLNEVLVSESTSSIQFGDLGTAIAPFVIGSGSSAIINNTTYSPVETLSGSIDDLRFFHSVRSIDQQKAYARKAIYPTDDLKLYFKFNEPSGSLLQTNNVTDSSIVIDSSGNELHSKVTNFSYALRSTGSVASPLTYENVSLSPVLFPGFNNTILLNARLLLSASDYDESNKNMITKLIPQHYLLDGQAFDGIPTFDGNVGSPYVGTLPGTGQIGASQTFAAFLYVWAKFFDELKLYVDAFANVKHVAYDPTDTAPDNFLSTLIKWYGFNVPSFFSDTTIDQFINAENIQPEFGTNSHALQYVQNQIHRRILVNMLDIIKSKGTLHSIKAFIRSTGIDPDNSFRIREFGGPTRQQLSHAREKKTELHPVVDMRDALGVFTTPPLSASRIETGFPQPVGPMVNQAQFPPHGISSNASDGMLTSGSFTIEALYRFPMGKRIPVLATQSLFRMTTAGSTFDSISSDKLGTHLNVIATSASLPHDVPAIRAYLRNSPNWTGVAPTLVMQLTGVNIFDGERWNVSVVKTRSDAFKSAVSSSYYLRVGRVANGSVFESHVTSSYFYAGSGSILTSLSPSYNVSGSSLEIGNRTLSAGTSGAGFQFLNDTTNVTAEARTGVFQGQVSHIRFWSKDISDLEWREHVRNPRSAGVEHPGVNFSFETVATGSFERLRLDVTTDQTTLAADAFGSLSLFDYSQNGFHMSGTLLSGSRRVLLADIMQYSLISPSIDEAVTSDKVRPRSFLNYDNVKESSIAQVAPVYDPDPSEPPMDDTRFSIEFSIIDALNRDIITIFSTLDELDNVLGNPEIMFADDYPGLAVLRKMYLNRLVSKLNFRGFFEFFKWFDDSISSFIEQLIPRKTRFYGTNFVIESHMLERSRKRYFHFDNYLGQQNRIMSVRDILLQQIAGSVRKF